MPRVVWAPKRHCLCLHATTPPLYASWCGPHGHAHNLFHPAPPLAAAKTGRNTCRSAWSRGTSTHAVVSLLFKVREDISLS